MKREAILQLLPELFRDDSGPEPVNQPLQAILNVMSDFLSGREHVLETYAQAFSAYRCTDEFVPLLARWLDLELLLTESGTEPIPTGVGRLRELVERTPELARRRGTAAGLQLFLEIATGVSGFEIDEAPAQEFRFRVQVPAAARPHAGLVRRIIALEKPAFARCEVVGLDELP